MLAALSIVLLLAAPDPAELLGSKDVKQRLQAVASLSEKGGDGAEALLIKALRDSDWEVVHHAAIALGKRGGETAVKPLAELAVEGPTRRIRLSAAESLKAVDPTNGAKLVARRLKGDTLFAASQALAVLGDTTGARQVERMLKNRDAEKRVAAVRALGAERRRDRIELWTKMLADPDLRVHAEAIRALVLTANQYAVRPLCDGLKRPLLSQVLQRRYIRAVRDLSMALKDKEQQDRAGELCVRNFGTATRGDVNARFARLLGSMGRREKPVGNPAAYVDRLLSAGIGNSDLAVRRATVAALARIGDDRAWEKVHAAATTDAAWQVRFHALRAAVRLRGKNALKLVLDRIRYDESKHVREEAATIAGGLGEISAVKTLSKALKDPAWEVVVCASVSLGKLHSPDAVAPLLELVKHKDWRIRGGVAAGLARVRSKKAVPVLIDMLRDKETAVSATARESLRHLAGENIKAGKAKDKGFKEWWAKKGPTFTFRDPDKEARDAKKYGYAVTRRGVYENLDVVVLVTRRGGDNIQMLLTDYEIEHREIRAASVSKTGLHPYAVFVANCPGEIVPDDVERLQWFVRVGGYLFASCWALTHTVHRAFPEVVDKLPQKGQVIGTVEAVDVNSESPYMKGVFDRATSPLYELMGSHLIRVLDPERFEVLIDSPQAASIWGDGNLAGWFTVGHGTILDSANHFDLQGMKNARLKTEKDRMAFAMDRLGYGYEELRELKGEGVFRKSTDAAKKTRDLSTFRFITRFVREKRIADEG
ncbi:MAG: HEAT repeat domain-containing protein [Planctomycetota bacterium]|jgi:HEAT repeat protein